MATAKRQPAPTPKIQPSAEKRSETISANWSGPLPPPGALNQFNDIIPNGAERIMALVEQEQEHRHKMERTAIKAEIWDTLGGKCVGAVMTLAAIAACVASVKMGAHWSVSIAIVSVPITALIGKFLNRGE